MPATVGGAFPLRRGCDMNRREALAKGGALSLWPFTKLASAREDRPSDLDQRVNLSQLRAAFDDCCHRDTFRLIWDRFDQLTDGGRTIRGTAKHYPTETAIVFLSAWACTDAPKYRDAAIRVFEFAHAQEREGLLIYNDGAGTPAFSRDPQARQIYNFYAAYALFGHLDYLHWADRCAEAMLSRIPRVPHRRAEIGTLFAANVFPHGTSVNPATAIDANMNCEIALAFGLLYRDPRSRLQRRDDIKVAVESEVSAALSLQRDDGRLALHEDHAECFDTLYGGYAAFSLVWLNSLGKNPLWDQRTKKLGDWLGRYSGPAKPHADRCYPTRANELGGGDLWYRIPPLWRVGISPWPLISHYLKEPEPSTVGRAFLASAYYELVGIPPKFYLEPRV